MERPGAPSTWRKEKTLCLGWRLQESCADSRRWNQANPKQAETGGDRERDVKARLCGERQAGQVAAGRATSGSETGNIKCRGLRLFLSPCTALL